MNPITTFIFIAIVAGAVLPVQAGLNAKMGKAIGDPVYAALISFVVGSVGLFIYTLVTKVDWYEIGNAKSLHWSIWTAGILGAFYVVSVIFLAPRLGTALTFGLIVAGQLGTSLILDHFGSLGLPIHTINWPRVLGIVLIITGVILIRNY